MYVTVKIQTTLFELKEARLAVTLRIGLLVCLYLPPVEYTQAFNHIDLVLILSST